MLIYPCNDYEKEEVPMESPQHYHPTIKSPKLVEDMDIIHVNKGSNFALSLQELIPEAEFSWKMNSTSFDGSKVYSESGHGTIRPVLTINHVSVQWKQEDRITFLSFTIILHDE